MQRTVVTNCNCPLEAMKPVREANDLIRCGTCSKTVTEPAMNKYERYYGYSGYDEDERDEIDVE